MGDVRLSGNVRIPESELEVGFARAGGPGGQHVNTSATKVELRWDVEASQALTAAQKARVRTALRNRITADGVLVLAASEHRSQARNRDAVIGRFANLVGEAIRPPKQRRPTRPPKAAKERRLEAKRQQSEKKALRRDPEI
jgi:ribosome-associated protein